MDGNKFLFDRIDEAIQATGQSNEYYRGMCNGMLFAKSLIDGAEPEYFKSTDAGMCQNSPVAPTGANACPAYNNELRKAAEPLYDYLLKCGDPHTCVVVTQRGATLKRVESGVAFVKGGASEREETFEREIREIVGGDKARGEANELTKANARIAELKEKLRDRETALSMRREESEKRLYEIMNLRGKVEVFEEVLACVKAFGGGA